MVAPLQKFVSIFPSLEGVSTVSAAHEEQHDCGYDVAAEDGLMLGWLWGTHQLQIVVEAPPKPRVVLQMMGWRGCD